MAGELEKNRQSGVINFGAWTQAGFEKIITRAARIRSVWKRIEHISRQFLGVEYKEETLVGDKKTPEKVIVGLSGLDCFTYIDYVEACRLSDSFLSFKDNLVRVRYKAGIIAYKHRNHFFTDWVVANKGIVEDVTRQIGGRHTLSSRKLLNKKEDGSVYLPEIEPVERSVYYIPAVAINDSVVRKCRSGDYIGIYSETPGLDVSHVGIFVRRNGRAYLRHASSVYRKVVDQEFTGYMCHKPGFLVLRPTHKKNGR